MLQRDYLAFIEKNLLLKRISLYWFTRGNVLSIDKQFVGLSFTKVVVKPFSLAFCNFLIRPFLELYSKFGMSL